MTDGQLDDEFRARSAVAFHRHFSAVLLHDSIHDRKAKAGANARRLRGEERIENARGDARGNAGAVVGNFEHDSLLRAKSGPRANPHVSLSAVFQQRLFGVHQQVQDDLLQLIGVGHRFRQVRRSSHSTTMFSTRNS